MNNQTPPTTFKKTFLTACLDRLGECRDLVAGDETLPVAHRRFLACAAGRTPTGATKALVTGAQALLREIEQAHPATTARAARRAGV